MGASNEEAVFIDTELAQILEEHDLLTKMGGQKKTEDGSLTEAQKVKIMQNTDAAFNTLKKLHPCDEFIRREREARHKANQAVLESQMLHMRTQSILKKMAKSAHGEGQAGAGQADFLDRNAIESELRILFDDEISKTKRLITDNAIDGTALLAHCNSEDELDRYLNKQFGAIWTLRHNDFSEMARSLIALKYSLSAFSVSETVRFVTAFDVNAITDAIAAGDWKDGAFKSSSQSHFVAQLTAHRISDSMASALWRKLIRSSAAASQAGAGSSGANSAGASSADAGSSVKSAGASSAGAASDETNLRDTPRQNPSQNPVRQKALPVFD